MGNLSDLFVEVMHFIIDNDSGFAHIQQFPEIRMVLVENGPKLQIDEGCFFELLENLFLEVLDLDFGEEIKEVLMLEFRDFPVNEVFEPGVLVELVDGQVILLDLQEHLHRLLLGPGLVVEDGVFQLQFRVHRGQLASTVVNHSDDVLETVLLFVVIHGEHPQRTCLVVTLLLVDLEVAQEQSIVVVAAVEFEEHLPQLTSIWHHDLTVVPFVHILQLEVYVEEMELPSSYNE